MNFSRQEKNILILLSTILVVSIGIFLYKTWLVSIPEEGAETNLPNSYMVQIAGEVIRPGVYQVEKGTRLYQLIELAGGTTQHADLSGLNLAAPVHDGLRIDIPSHDSPQVGLFEKPFPDSLRTPSSGTNSGVSSTSKSLVNINTASLEELKRLPGIGDVIAQRIIDYREANGAFRTADELLKVKGIGNKKLQDIKDLISF